MDKKLRYALKHKKSAGQAIVEYIIIVAIVAIGALTVIGLFGDRIKAMFSGATGDLGGMTTEINDGDSKEALKELDASGSDD